MKLKLTPPIAMAGVAGVILVGCAATFFIPSNAPAKEDDPSFTIGRKHVLSKTLPASHEIALGETMPDLTLTDLKGDKHRLSDWHGKPVVFVFADTVCPCVKAYKDRVQAFNDKFTSDGLQLVSIYPDASETPAQVRRYVEKQGYPGITVKDEGQKLLRLFGANCTTETFLVDGNGKLRYHGRIDDSTYKPEQVKVRDLQNAMTSVLAGGKVATSETQTYGCAFTLQQKKVAQLG